MVVSALVRKLSVAVMEPTIATMMLIVNTVHKSSEKERARMKERMGQGGAKKGGEDGRGGTRKKGRMRQGGAKKGGEDETGRGEEGGGMEQGGAKKEGGWNREGRRKRGGWEREGEIRRNHSFSI